MLRRTTLLLVCLLSIAAFTALGADKAKRVDVSIKQMQFIPATIAVRAGDTVVWINNDDRDHSVVAGDGSFRSGNISAGDKYEHQFMSAGTFSYKCGYHPRMKGTVTVQGN